MVNDGAHLRKQHLVTSRHCNHPPHPIVLRFILLYPSLPNGFGELRVLAGLTHNYNPN